MRKLVLLALFISLLAGCGFKLRGVMNLPYESIYVNGGGNPAVQAALENAILSGTKAQLAPSPDKAQVVVNILSASYDKIILSLGGTGRVREYQLIYRLAFSATYLGKPSIPPQQIELRRDMTYDDTQALAKEQEEALLNKSMQDDAIQQLLRRLKGAAATQPAQATP
jgi:Rare lipoprotein B